MKHELPAIEIGERLWWPVLVSEDVSWSEGPGDPMFGTIQAVAGPDHDEWRRMDVDVLAALVVTLPDEQKIELRRSVKACRQCAIERLEAQAQRDALALELERVKACHRELETELHEVKTGYVKLDQSWEIVHNAAMNPIRRVTCDGTVREIVEAIQHAMAAAQILRASGAVPPAMAQLTEENYQAWQAWLEVDRKETP